MLRALIEAVVAVFSLGGFWATFASLRRVWRRPDGERLSPDARRRRFAANAQALAARHGTGRVAGAALLLVAGALFLPAACVLVPCLVFHDAPFWRIACALGLLLRFRRVTYLLGERLHSP